jgi:hypothetical protein
MKNIKVVPYILAVLLVTACHQEVITPPDPPAPSGEPGSADFTKFVSIGNSLTAGFQAGALYTDGQQNSFPAIMAKQFALVSDNDNFDQPDINSVNGYNSSFSNPGAGVIPMAVAPPGLRQYQQEPLVYRHLTTQLIYPERTMETRAN